MKLHSSLFIILALFLAACSSPEASQETNPEPQAEVADQQAGTAYQQQVIEPDVRPGCSLPRVTIDGICCFDTNGNGVCDSEEPKEESNETDDAAVNGDEIDGEPQELEEHRELEEPVDQAAVFLDALELTEGDFRDFPEALSNGRDTVIIVGDTGATVAAAINLQLWLLGEGIEVADTRPPAETYDDVVLDFRNNLIIIGDCSHPYGFCDGLESDAELRYYELGNRAVITIIGNEEVDANEAVNALINGDLSLQGHLITQ